MIAILRARFPADAHEVFSIFREYVASPSVSLDFQDYEREFADLPGKYAEPDGRILLTWEHSAVVGCVALRRVAADFLPLRRRGHKEAHPEDIGYLNELADAYRW